MTWAIEVESWVIPFIMPSVRTEPGFYIVPMDASKNRMILRKRY